MNKLPVLEKWIMVNLTQPTFVGIVKKHNRLYNGFTVQLQFVDLNPITRTLFTKYRYFDETTQQFYTRNEEFILGEPDVVWANSRRF